tara:strand:- start:347 stop:652 length:306 start_codon:yes stop_codon:yes gene_type:complete
MVRIRSNFALWGSVFGPSAPSLLGLVLTGLGLADGVDETRGGTPTRESLFGTGILLNLPDLAGVGAGPAFSEVYGLDPGLGPIAGPTEGLGPRTGAIAGAS